MSNIPVYLSKKRRFLKQSQDDVNFTLEGRDKTLKQWSIKIRNVFSQLGTALHSGKLKKGMYN